MERARDRFDVVVIGSGPAGQKAAVQAVKAGARTALIEREAHVGGACVHRGTIPSKTLRDTAQKLGALANAPGLDMPPLPADLEVQALLQRQEHVVRAHVDYMRSQMDRNGVDLFHGRGRFVSEHEVVVRAIDGSERVLEADLVVITAGSRPRIPDEIPVDHENVLDSDSILSIAYLPSTLVVLGGGVIACEYASIFARLGVNVTLVDRASRPLGFMDAPIVDRFLSSFEASGGRYVSEARVEQCAWDGLSSVQTRLSTGEELRSDKLLVALGRVANADALDLGAAGLGVNDRGHIPVDETGRTAVPNIYAAGDVIGPPALASTSMEQGRRAVCHALGVDPGRPAEELAPVGIYTIPEMASVGLGEEEAARRHGAVVVGKAKFDEVARGQISGISDGLLRLVTDGAGRRILGVHIVGEGATELVHLGQAAILAGWEPDHFVENIFNFPTLAEAYRVAAFDVIEQRDVAARAA